MKKLLIPVFIVFCFATLSHAQDSLVTKPYKVAIFAPLYLDSAIDQQTNEYKYAKNTFPKFINPGLEFYEGAQLALDSLSRIGDSLEVFIFDTRSATQSLQQQLNSPEIRDAQLIIAHCSSNEVRIFAEEGLKRKIPVINTTIPNDGGTTANPYFVVINPTLKTQVEGIYKLVQKYYALNPIIVFRKKGATENQIKTILDDYSKVALGSPIKLKYVDLIDSFTINHLKAHLDSNKRSVCIAGSLDGNFGRRLAYQLASINKTYPLTIIGMPTWDGNKDFSRPEYKGVEIIYSNPFYNPRTDKVSQSIGFYFANNMYARPSDMVFRGYEATWNFCKLLLKYGKDLASNLGNKEHKVFTGFDIQPVLSKGTVSLQYFENKKLNFLKWQDGLIKTVN